MSDTTAVLEELLARFQAGDASAKSALVQHAYDRLLVLASGHLRQFPGIRKNEESAAILHRAYERISQALDDVFFPGPGRDLAPPTVEAFFGLAGRHIRWLLLELARAGNRGRQPRPAELPIGPAGSDGGVDPPGPGSNSEVGRVSDVLEAVERLSEEHRKAYDLTIVGGLTIDDAARAVGLSRDRMKRLWVAARKELGGMLKAYCIPGASSEGGSRSTTRSRRMPGDPHAPLGVHAGSVARGGPVQ